MNIIKLQNMLRGAPDEALINYVQNPQGEVPSYLALSELQRRKDTRDKYQAEQAPETSVAEDLGQEAMSDQSGLAMLAGQPQMQMEDQGVAGLDTGDMYQEDSFAGGGIVAFAPGGPVYPNYYGENEEEVTSPLGRLINYLDISGKVKKSDFGKRREERKKLDEQIQETVPTLIGGKRGFFDQETKAQQREYDQRRRELEAQKEKSPFFAPEPGGFVYDKKEAIDPTMKSYKEQELAKEKPKAIKSKPTTENIGTAKDNASQASQQTAETDEDYLRRRMALFKEAMGPNEDRTKLQEKIDKMEKRAARQEELAPWMALTEAGFKTMQGTSPYALANIGAGAEAGIKSYGGAQDKMAALEEKRYALMNDAAKADRAERQAAIQFGENSYQHQAALQQRERLGLAELEVRREANRLTKDFNTARLSAIQDKGLLKSQAEQMIKVNKDIDKQIATFSGRSSDPKVKAYLDGLRAEKTRNEAHVKSIYDNLRNPGLAGTETSATNADPLGILSQ